MTIHSPFGGAPEASLRRFERAHDLRLPTDYREFLKDFNGGVPEPRSVYVPASKQDIFVDILFGINSEQDFDLATWLLEYRDEMPAGFLIIGADPGGNLFLLADERAGNGVFYWDHTFTFDPSTEAMNTYPVAASFTQFLAALK